MVTCLAIIIDVIMVGKNMIKKVMHDSATQQLQICNYSKSSYDKGLNKLHRFFLDSKYTEEEIMKHINENELEITNLLNN